MQKLVKGATKPKAAAPKAKYVEPILSTTFEGGHDFEVVMDSLSKVIASRNGTWPSLYKALIMVHIMIREGSEEITLKYISRHPRMFDLEDHVHRAPAMGRYARYLAVRGQQYKEAKIDYIRYKTRQGFSRLHSLSVQKGLIRECGSVLVQLEALMKCQYQEQDIVNDDLLLMAFRLLVHDALSLFQVLNEGVINLLEHFFELPKSDAEQALDIYRGFRRITSKVISYLRIAKDMEYKTMLHVPNIKHAPTSLVSSLEMYVSDPDFDSNRRQYLAEKQAHELKRTRSQTQSHSSTTNGSTPTSRSVSAPQGHSQFMPDQMLQTVQFTSANTNPELPAQNQPTPAIVNPSSAMNPSLAMSSNVNPHLTNQTTGMVPQSTGNPFWQTQQEAAQIQNADGQAQLQMQQLHRLQMEQLQQQEALRQQLQQQQLQQQQLQQQQLQQQQQQHMMVTAQQTAMPPSNVQQPQPQPQPLPMQQIPSQNPSQPYLESNTTGGFDFGLQPTMNTQPAPQPLVYGQANEYNPFKRASAQSIPPSAVPTIQPVVQSQQLNPTVTGTNPFKSPSRYSTQFAALDNVGNQMQPNLIDFGQSQTAQATGGNPFLA